MEYRRHHDNRNPLFYGLSDPVRNWFGSQPSNQRRQNVRSVEQASRTVGCPIGFSESQNFRRQAVGWNLTDEDNGGGDEYAATKNLRSMLCVRCAVRMSKRSMSRCRATVKPGWL